MNGFNPKRRYKWSAIVGLFAVAISAVVVGSAQARSVPPHCAYTSKYAALALSVTGPGVRTAWGHGFCHAIRYDNGFLTYADDSIYTVRGFRPYTNGSWGSPMCVFSSHKHHVKLALITYPSTSSVACAWLKPAVLRLGFVQTK